MSIEDNLQMIEDCENRSEKLTDWELEFIDSVSRYTDKGGFLSPRQEQMLEKIWDKVTA